MTFTKLSIAALSAFAIAQAPTAFARIEKSPAPCADKLCLWERPAIDAPAGWRLDKPTSVRTLVSVYLPADVALPDAPGVFYAKALALDGMKFTTFVANDLDRVLAQQLSLTATPTTSLRSGDQASALTYRLAPRRNSPGGVETYAYLEEDGYALVFVLSARDDATHRALSPLFKRWVGGYRRAGSTTGSAGDSNDTNRLGDAHDKSGAGSNKEADNKNEAGNAVR